MCDSLVTIFQVEDFYARISFVLFVRFYNDFEICNETSDLGVVNKQNVYGVIT